MSFFKKIAKEIGKGAEFVNANVELAALKHEREKLNEEFSRARELHEDYKKKLERRKPLEELDACFTEKINALRVLASGDPETEALVATLLSQQVELQSAIARWKEGNDMDEGKFAAETAKYEEESQRIKTRLSHVRKIIH